MECQILFSRKNQIRKNIISCHLLNLPITLESVKIHVWVVCCHLPYKGGAMSMSKYLVHSLQILTPETAPEAYSLQGTGDLQEVSLY